MLDLPKGYRIEKAKVKEEDLICPVCRSRVMYGFGMWNGKVLICINYPGCNYIKKIEDRIVLEGRWKTKKPYKRRR